ncbi:MAG: hypothetical protein ABIV39_02985, partial [Verrucomicrobiota bacterium]
GGNGYFTAMVYAPLAALTLNGGGKSVEDFSGACLVKSVTLNGSYNFHFDESCASAMLRGYVATSWDEINTSFATIFAKNYTAKDLNM